MKLIYDAPKHSRIKSGTFKRFGLGCNKTRFPNFLHIHVDHPTMSLWFTERGDWFDLRDPRTSDISRIYDAAEILLGYLPKEISSNFHGPKSVKAFRRFVKKSCFPKGAEVTFVSRFEGHDVKIKIK